MGHRIKALARGAGNQEICRWTVRSWSLARPISNNKTIYGVGHKKPLAWVVYNRTFSLALHFKLWRLCRQAEANEGRHNMSTLAHLLRPFYYNFYSSRSRPAEVDIGAEVDKLGLPSYTSASWAASTMVPKAT